MAVTELGLSPEYFWGLTWYEWGLYALKIYKQSQKELADRELQIEIARRFMTLFANAHRGKGKLFKPTDFWRLSYDTQLTPVSDPELFARVAKRLGGTIKKKKDSEHE
jgi:hypothetical protein